MLNNSNIKTQEVIKNLELAVKSLMNKNAVIYSNRSKSTESLSNGSCSLTINTLNKSFVFSYGSSNHNVIINPLNQAISNLNLINDIHVDDIITAQNIMKNQYLIDMFSNIDAVLNLYKKFVVIDEQNESVSLTRGSVKIAKLISEQITSKSLNTESLLINGVDLVKELNDLNRYVDRFVEETDLNFTIVNKEINDFKTDATNKFEVYDESISNLNTNVISINEQIIDIDNNYDEFREEFKTHTHDGKYIKPVDIEPLASHIEELRNKTTGIEYNKIKIGTVEEEDIYEIYTSINQDVKINGLINGVDITKSLQLQNDALVIKDLISMNKEPLASHNNTETTNLILNDDGSLIFSFSNGNSISFEPSGEAVSITHKGSKYYYNNFLTKQMLIVIQEQDKF